MSDLFSSANAATRIRPLAVDLRPSSLDEVIGQTHILGPGTQLRRRIAAGRIGTVILFGPPGIGKTTIAKAVGAAMNKVFRQLHPAYDKVKEIQAVADEARDKSVLLFIDEIHRYSATQQDHLLSLSEDGVVDLLGATTGNPYHVLTPALVSRATIMKLEPLSVEEMEDVIRRAIKHMRGKGITIEIAPEVLRSLAGRASGDARRAINAFEGLVSGVEEGGTLVIDQVGVDEIYNASPIPYDRAGDAHYDVISAFIKSMRGSDPDATLYWLARLIHAGEDPRFIARRMLIHASEDVGLADNSALATAVAALNAVQHVGYPEAQIVLAHAALHIARAPKSNSACRGIGLALAHVKSQPATPVPPHLRDGHYAGAAKLGHTGYAFPHDTPMGWVEQSYADGIKPGDFYQSDARGGGTFEKRADDYWSAVTGRPQPSRFHEE